VKNIKEAEMFKRRLLFILLGAVLIILSYAPFSTVYAQICTDNDGDTYAIEGAACGAVDCDDNDPNVHPGAVEICDGKDSNCDGWSPPTDKDTDGDGTPACAGDCDDSDVNTFPGAPELCGDGKDNNCNYFIDENGCICPDSDGDGETAAYCGGTDCDDNDPLVQINCVGCTDNDGDGVAVEGGNCGPVDCDDSDPLVKPGVPDICDGKDTNCDGWKSPTDRDVDGDGSAVCAGDCNDNDSSIFPGAAELCDGVDNNCDFIIPANEKDIDNDGSRSCDIPSDCNDNDPAVNPGQPEICADGKDNDCDTEIDEVDCVVTCIDNDGDGYGTNAYLSCPNGAVNDCDDNDPAVNPGAVEGPFGQLSCTDTKDNDCDGLIDSAEAACQGNCIDNDGDGYGANGDISCPAGTAVDCNDNDPGVNPGATDICDGKDTDCDGFTVPSDVDSDGDGVAKCANDCNDTNPDIFPGAPELCDGIDNNCDFVVPLNERDSDGDGFRTCDIPGDCNDNNPNQYPGHAEECDNIDNDCNGTVDDSCSCTDADGDGQLSDHPLCGGGDCDNTDPTVYTGAAEICTDGKDNDCDGAADFQDADRVNCPGNCVDNDGDQYFMDISNSGIDCGDADCDDNDPNVHPGAADICDGKDTNCDGFQVSSDRDNDGDGVPLCAGDCDDNDPDRSPNLLEHPLRDTCNDGIDNDCDSAVDEADSACAPRSCNTKTSPKDSPHFFTLMNPGAVLTDPVDDTVHPDNNIMICEKCHAPDFADPVRFACQRCHADPADTSDPLNGTFKNQYPLDPPYGYGSAPNVGMHDSTVVGTKYGNWTMGSKGCVVCHNPHAQEQNNTFGTDYGMFIKEYICYDNDVTLQSVEELVELTAPSGSGSFADGGPHTANVCEMCHTRTNHHQRDGSAPGGQSHLDGQRCTYCHVHADGFLPTNSQATSPHNTELFNNNCDLCHVSTGPNPEDVDYRAIIPDENCQRCHGERTSHTSDTGRNPDASGSYTYNIMCVDCHNPMLPVEGNRKLLKPYINFNRADGSGNTNGSVMTNTTRRGAGSLGDGAPNDRNQCTVCHSLTSHDRYDGAGGGVHADSTDRSSSYCIVCHDHNRSFMAPGKTCAEENAPGINCEP